MQTVEIIIHWTKFFFILTIIVVTDFSRICLFNNFCCSQSKKNNQNDDISDLIGNFCRRQWWKLNRTRQKLMQSFGNMLPLPPQQILSGVLQIMPRNPRYEQFNKVKVVLKWVKSTDSDQNLISSEGSQDTSTCQMSGHSFQAFSGKCLEGPNLTYLTKSKLCQNLNNQQIMTIIWLVMKVVSIHLDAKFQAILFMCFPGNAKSPRIWPVSLCQSCTKIRNINRMWPSSYQFWRWSE